MVSSRVLECGTRNFDAYVLSLGFEHSKSDHCVYYKSDGDHFLLYFDDMLFGKGKGMISELKSQLSATF